MKSGHPRKLGWPFFFVRGGARLVAAEPPFGGERGSLPRTFCVGGTAPGGCRGECGAWRRHLADRDRAGVARRSLTTVRELNLARRRRWAPRLLGALVGVQESRDLATLARFVRRRPQSVGAGVVCSALR